MLKITNYKNKIIFLSVIWILLLIAVSIWSVFTGQYPLTIKGLLDGDKMMLMVFFRLRLPRVIMGIIGGFGLSIAGYVYQLVFKNPLASPDIAGVSSGQVPVQHLLSLQFQLQHHLFQYVHLQEV